MAQQTSASKEVFVGGTDGISKRELRKHFGSYGWVSSVRLAFDRITGRRRGFGFVQFEHESSAQHAILVGRHHNIAGQHVTVQPARAASLSYTPGSINSKSRPDQRRINCGDMQNQMQPCADQVANARHIQSQQRHGISTPASPSLFDICHEVPTLPDLLNMDDQKALSAVSKSLHRSFVAKIQAVTVTTQEDLVLVNQSWPLLSMVTLQTQHGCSVLSPPARSLACVGVSGKVPVPVSTPDLSRTSSMTHMRESEVHQKIFILTPLHTSGPLALTSPATQQLAHYLMAKCPKLTSFSLDHLELPAAGVAVIAQLFKGDCSPLLHLNLLNLSQCGLTTQDCLVLSQGNWPALRMLMLAHNWIDAAGKGKVAPVVDISAQLQPCLGC